MNGIQASTILYALRRLVDEIEMDRPEPQLVYAQSLRDRHGERAVPMTADEISALADDISVGSLPIIVVEMKDGPRVFADCGRVIVIDMDSGTQDTPVPEEGGKWARRNVYRPACESIPDYARDWAELIVRLMPEDADD
jgi:hypothetical protein